MSDSSWQPTERFTSRTDLYARYRPVYPEAAIDRLLQVCGLPAAGLVADVGCGTGISTRLLAERGVSVIGIEPNDAMRASGETTPSPAGAAPLSYRNGTAEATGLADGAVAVVVAAQAFHWFAAEVALREFHRILQPGGWVALLWNERDESDPCTAAYGKVIRTAPDTAAIEGPRAQAGWAVVNSPLFEEGRRETFAGSQEVDEEGLLGRAFSASYAPTEPAAVEAFGRGLREVFAAFQREGKVTIRYETSLYLGRRREG
jgi:ubiquinone/menaquinone biosynthesis C-methylase UbiE